MHDKKWSHTLQKTAREQTKIALMLSMRSSHEIKITIPYDLWSKQSAVNHIKEENKCIDYVKWWKLMQE
jgi:hypothetical protein